MKRRSSGFTLVELLIVISIVAIITIILTAVGACGYLAYDYLTDDEHGINRQAFRSLADWLEDEGCDDIVDAVEACEGRYYIAAETAQELRQVSPED